MCLERLLASYVVVVEMEAGRGVGRIRHSRHLGVYLDGLVEGREEGHIRSPDSGVDLDGAEEDLEEKGTVVDNQVVAQEVVRRCLEAFLQSWRRLTLWQRRVEER